MYLYIFKHADSYINHTDTNNKNITSEKIYANIKLACILFWKFVMML